MKHIKKFEDNSNIKRPYRFTWRHEVYIEANSEDEATDKWEELNLGELDKCVKDGEIEFHNFVELVSVDPEESETEIDADKYNL